MNYPDIVQDMVSGSFLQKNVKQIAKNQYFSVFFTKILLAFSCEIIYNIIVCVKTINKRKV